MSICLGAFHASAAPLDVVNPGFEDNSVGISFNEFTFGPPSGWDLYDPGDITDEGDGPTYYVGTLTPSPYGVSGDIQFFPGGAYEGSRVGIAYNAFGSGGRGEYGLAQTLDDTVQVNTEYNLSVRIGNIASGFGQNGTFFNLDGFPGYRVDLLAVDNLGGVSVLASDSNSLAETPNEIPEGDWGLSTVTYTTGDTSDYSGDHLGIRLVNLNVVDTTNANTAAADLEVDFDEVQLTASSVVIPEPASLTLVGVGGFLMFGRRSRACSFDR